MPGTTPRWVVPGIARKAQLPDQLGLGGGEYVVGKHALLVQRGQLVQLVDHGRRLGWSLRRRSLRRGLLIARLLLFHVADARVLIVLVLLPLHRVPGMALPGHVRAATDHGRAQQRTSPPEHHCLLVIVALQAVGQGEAQGEHELGRRRHQLRPPDLRGDRDQDAHEVFRGCPFRQRVADLPEVRGGRGIERDQRGQLDQRIATAVETALALPVRPRFQALGQQVRVAQGQRAQHFPGVVVDLYLGWRGHGQSFRELAWPGVGRADPVQVWPALSGSAAGRPISSISPRTTSSRTASRMTTSPVGWPQKTKMRANRATAPIRRPRRCAYVHSPTGPVDTPRRSPKFRTQPVPDFRAERVWIAVCEGPVMNAPMATTKATASTTRSVILMKYTMASNAAAAASPGSTLGGTLLR